MSITDSKLKAISKLDEYTGPSEINDGQGLIAKVSPKAKITFQYRCRVKGENKRIRIGKYPLCSLKKAREIHKRMLELRDKCLNPEIAITGETDFVTLKDCVDFWLKNKVSNLSEGTKVLYHSFAKNYYYPAFQNVDVEGVTAREWMIWFDAIAEKNPTTANSSFSKLRACLNFCKSKFLIDGTHFEKIRQRDVGEPPKVGDRVLALHELAQIWVGIERSQASTSTKNLLLLSMLWGNRLSELRLSRRNDFDMDKNIWTVPAQNSKMKNIIRRPITKQIRPIIMRLLSIYDDFLFPGQSLNKPICLSAANRYIRRMRHSMPLDHWKAHDFRRSISTICSELGSMPHVTEKMLGHKLEGVMLIYNKHDWLKEQNEAYEKFADALFVEIEKTLRK